MKWFKWVELTRLAINHAECVTCEINSQEIEYYHDSSTSTLFEQDLSLELNHVKFMYPKIRLTFKNSIENHFVFVAQFDIWNAKTHDFQRIYQTFSITKRE